VAKAPRFTKAKPSSPRQALISWEGDSRDVLSGWPVDVKVDLGFALREMQSGRPAMLQVRPMQSIGDGVFELKTSDDATWYRLVYLKRVADVIYVLHCFEKDTRKTESKDIRLATQRLAAVHERLREEERNAKREKHGK
jgi:phage-related protein